MLRKFLVFALALGALVVAGGAAAAKPDANPTVTILTQNMDDGTDQTYIIAATLGLVPFTVADAVDLTYLELQYSAFALRASVLAAEIALKNPGPYQIESQNIGTGATLL